MRLSIACLFWATIIGFLIQIFLTLGKTEVVSECTPPLLALWLSFFLITWDPLGRLSGAADVGEMCRGEITCWDCLAVVVQRLSATCNCPISDIANPALRGLLLGLCCLELTLPHFYTIMHLSKMFSSFVYLYSFTGTAELFLRVQLLPGITKESFHCFVPVCSCYFKRWDFLSCATGTATRVEEKGKKKKNNSCIQN